MKIIMGLSGGVDSASLLGLLLDQGHSVHCCIFSYGSKHNKWENGAAKTILAFYQTQDFLVSSEIIDITNLMQNFKSDLLLSGGEIPEGHYESENMYRTVVPGRNTIFISIMTGLAESIGAEQIALGTHSGDHHIYPDCRKEYVKAIDSAIYLASGKKVEVIAPLIDDNKTTIIKKGLSLIPPIPYHLTRTCYKDQPLACGKCGSCNERLEAFANIGKTDPIQYE